MASNGGRLDSKPPEVCTGGQTGGYQQYRKSLEVQSLKCPEVIGGNIYPYHSKLCSTAFTEEVGVGVID